MCCGFCGVFFCFCCGRCGEQFVEFEVYVVGLVEVDYVVGVVGGDFDVCVVVDYVVFFVDGVIGSEVVVYCVGEFVGKVLCVVVEVVVVQFFYCQLVGWCLVEWFVLLCVVGVVVYCQVVFVFEQCQVVVYCFGLCWCGEVSLQWIEGGEVWFGGWFVGGGVVVYEQVVVGVLQVFVDGGFVCCGQFCLVCCFVWFVQLQCEIVQVVFVVVQQVV